MSSNCIVTLEDFSSNMRILRNYAKKAGDKRSIELFDFCIEMIDEHLKIKTKTYPQGINRVTEI